MPAISRSNHPTGYSVRPGTINFGFKYETATAATLSLHHCKKKGIWLARNVDEVGNFDDIILCTPPVKGKNGDKITYLIQVKYNNERKILQKEHFTKCTKDNAQFWFENLLKDYLKLKDKIDNISTQDNSIYRHLQDEEDNIKYFLHTNRKVQADCDLLETVEHKFYYANSNGNLYKFKSNEIPTHMSSNKEIKMELFDNLFLYSENILFKDTNDALSGELKKLLCDEGINLDKNRLQQSAIIYKDFFENWETCLLNSKSSENYPLVREHIVTKITEILFNSFTFKFKGIDSQKLSSTCNVSAWDRIKDTEIIITDSDKRLYPLLKDYIKKINCNSIICSNNRTETEKCKIYHKPGSSSHSRLCMWMHKLSPQVLEIREHRELEDICKIMRLSDYNLRVLVINSTKRDGTSLRDMVKNSSKDPRCKNLVRYLSSSKLLPTTLGNPELINFCSNLNNVSKPNNNNIIPGETDENINKLIEEFGDSVKVSERINLLQAAKNKDVDTVKELLKKDEDVNSTDEFGKTPLHYSTWNKSLEITKILVENKASVNAKDRSGKIPLHCAVDAEDNDTIIFLLDNKAKIDEVDNENKTPLFYAVKNRYIETAELLLSRGANADTADALGRTAIYLAADRSDVEMVSLLLSKDASTELKYEGNAPLHRAVIKGSKEIANLLLEKKANIDVQNDLGKTALHLVCSSWPGKPSSRKINSTAVLRHAENYKSIITMLLAKGVNIRIQDSSKHAALFYAEKMLSNVRGYLDQGNIDNDDKNAEKYSLDRPCILKCYDSIVSLLKGKLMETAEQDNGM